MGILDFFRPIPVTERREPTIYADAGNFMSLDDPRVAEFLQLGTGTATGMAVTAEKALKNPAMFRAVSLIGYSIGMLPLNVIEKATKEKADIRLQRVLHRRPNGWQSAFDFKTLMQLRALVNGNAYALIVRSKDVRTGKQRVTDLIPLDPSRMTVEQNNSFEVIYRYSPNVGGVRIFKPKDIFHLRGISLNGFTGLSLVTQASEAIALALSAELAAGRVFKNGSFVGGSLEHPARLSDESYERLKVSLAEKEGAANAGKNLILEEGMKFAHRSLSARDAQMIDVRKHQVEEIARVTGVPRPLLMVDETSWGSGIYALGQFFVQYGLSPWFEAWQQAAERSLFDDEDVEKYEIKFNAGALLRGSIAEQGDYFAKALGSGGASAWMKQNEVRDVLDMPRVDGGDDLSKGSMAAAAPAKEIAAPKPAKQITPPKPNDDPDEDDDDED